MKLYNSETVFLVHLYCFSLQSGTWKCLKSAWILRVVFVTLGRVSWFQCRLFLKSIRLPAIKIKAVKMIKKWASDPESLPMVEISCLHWDSCTCRSDSRVAARLDWVSPFTVWLVDSAVDAPLLLVILLGFWLIGAAVCEILVVFCFAFCSEDFLEITSFSKVWPLLFKSLSIENWVL